VRQWSLPIILLCALLLLTCSEKGSSPELLRNEAEDENDLLELVQDVHNIEAIFTGNNENGKSFEIEVGNYGWFDSREFPISWDDSSFVANGSNQRSEPGLLMYEHIDCRGLVDSENGVLDSAYLNSHGYQEWRSDDGPGSPTLVEIFIAQLTLHSIPLKSVSESGSIRIVFEIVGPEARTHVSEVDESYFNLNNVDWNSTENPPRITVTFRE